jgi:transcriptional regulator with XRE-family HTH domain
MSDNEDDFYRHFGIILRDKRKSSGLSQEDLGTSVGLNRTSISNIEKGRQKILLHTFCDVARVLKVEPNSLLPTQHNEVAQSATPDLSGFGPSEIAFITKGIGLHSKAWKRSTQNADSTVKDSKSRQRGT